MVDQVNQMCERCNVLKTGEQREQDRLRHRQGAGALQEMNERELWKGWMLLTSPILHFYGGKLKKNSEFGGQAA